MVMPRVPGDVPQVPLQPTQMPGYAAPAVQPSQNFNPQQLQQLAAGIQDMGQVSSRIGSSMQREELQQQAQQKAEQKALAVEQERERDRVNDSITGEKLLQYRVEIGQYVDEYAKKEGVTARDGFQESMKGFDAINKKYAEFFQDPVQQQLWENKSILYREQNRRDITNHAHGQTRLVEKSNLAESIKLSRLDYSKSVTRQAAVEALPGSFAYMGQLIMPEAHKAVVVDSVKKLHEEMDKDFIESKVKSELQGLHKETVNGMLGLFQPKDIMSYLEKNKDEVSPEYYADMKASLQKSDRVAAAKSEATQIASELAVREIDGIKVLDEGTVAAFIAKQRDERAKRIAKGEVIDESYYDTRDSQLRQHASSDTKYTTAKGAVWFNEAEQVIFEMSNSEYQSYDADLNSGNVLDKLEQKYPVLYQRGKDLGLLSKVSDYARKTDFGANSDPYTYAMAKAYVEKNGKVADEAMFISSFGEGLSTADKKRLLTDIAIKKGTADKSQIADGDANTLIDMLIDKIGVTIDGKFNGENRYELTNDEHVSLQHQLKSDWVASKRSLPEGMGESKYFDQWITDKEKEITQYNGKTMNMARRAETKVSGPNYYTSTNKKVYDINDVDTEFVTLAVNELNAKNETRFYVEYRTTDGRLEISPRRYGNIEDAIQAAELLKKSNKPEYSFVNKNTVIPKETPFRAYLNDDKEVLQSAIDIAVGLNQDPNIGNRMNAISQYNKTFAGLNQNSEMMRLNVLRQSLVDGTYDRSQLISTRDAEMVTGLSYENFAAYGIKPSSKVVSMSTRFQVEKTSYTLSDLENAITPSFREAVRSKK